ncbi:MAG: hypothetical protein WBA25_19100 [Jannaschia sp.]
MINNRFDPALFARLLKLSPPIRTDLLELLGTTPVDAEELDRILSKFEEDQAEDDDCRPS